MNLKGNRLKAWNKLKKEYKTETDEDTIGALLDAYKASLERNDESLELLGQLQNSTEKEFSDTNETLKLISAERDTLKNQVLKYQSVFEAIELARLKTDMIIDNLNLAKKGA